MICAGGEVYGGGGRELNALYHVVCGTHSMQSSLAAVRMPLLRGITAGCPFVVGFQSYDRLSSGRPVSTKPAHYTLLWR